MPVTLNTISINKKLENLAQSKRYVGLMYNAANTRFVAAKQQLLEDYDDSEVVEELKKSSDDPSITNNQFIHPGNLTSAIGFEAGEHPEEELRKFINLNISMDSTPKITIQRNRVYFSFKVKTFTKSQIEESFPTPTGWSSRSWVSIIENGFPASLQRFVFNSEGFGDNSNSRSGTGLQLTGGRKRHSPVTFTPKKFLTEVMDEFISKFK